MDWVPHSFFAPAALVEEFLVKERVYPVVTRRRELMSPVPEGLAGPRRTRIFAESVHYLFG